VGLDEEPKKMARMEDRDKEWENKRFLTVKLG